MKWILKNNRISIPQEEETLWWMEQGLENFKTVTKEPGGNSNVALTENATNLTVCEEINREENWHKITHKKKT